MNSSPTIVQRYPKRRSVMRTTMPPISEKQKLARRARDGHFRAIMKISGLRAYRVELPLHEGSYKWSGGNAVTVFDSTVVAVDTDAGVTGWGEVCPLGPAYLPAYAEGARAGIRELGPALVGQDPREVNQINLLMDGRLRGHPYVKSALDMACWDILGKVAGLPVVTLLGGRHGES